MGNCSTGRGLNMIVLIKTPIPDDYSPEPEDIIEPLTDEEKKLIEDQILHAIKELDDAKEEIKNAKDEKVEELENTKKELEKIIERLKTINKKKVYRIYFMDKITSQIRLKVGKPIPNIEKDEWGELEDPEMKWQKWIRRYIKYTFVKCEGLKREKVLEDEEVYMNIMTYKPLIENAAKLLNGAGNG